MTDLQELLEMAQRCEDRALYNTSGDPMKLLKEAAALLRAAAQTQRKPYCIHGLADSLICPDCRVAPQENDDV